MYREWKEIELCWFGDVQRVEGNRISKRGEVREDGRTVGAEGWQEKSM
jgi:hypothetical protein